MTGERSPTLRVGLAGCGAIASYAHLRVLGHLRGVALVAVADPDPEARARARRLARVPVHDRAEDLLGRGDIDAIVICAPTPLHADLAVAAAAADTHFYLEKPIATNAEDAGRVVEAAARSGVAAATGFNRRHHPLYERARDILRAGLIGRVRGIQMASCEPAAPEVMPPWRLRRASGGGVLLDLASHHVDSLRWLLGDEIGEVAASVSSELSEDDTAHLQLSMRGGAEVHGFFSYRAGHADYLELLGERGVLRVDRFRPTLELRLRRRRRYGTYRAWLRPSPALATWRILRPFRPVREVSFRRSLEAYVELVRGRPRRVASLEDGRRCLEVLLAAEATTRPRRDAPTLANA